jgi:hypothetical protein
MAISGAFERKGDNVTLELTISNQGSMPLSGFAIQFDKNV